MTYPPHSTEGPPLPDDATPPPPPSHLGRNITPTKSESCPLSPSQAEVLATAKGIADGIADAFCAVLDSLTPEANGHGTDPQDAEFDLEATAGTRFDEADPLQLESRGLTSHAQQTLRTSQPPFSQSEFWTAQTVLKNSIAAKARLAGRADIAEGLEHCHTEYTHTVCNDCGKQGRFPNRCDKFYCPECQPRNAHDRRESVEWWAKEVKQPKHVVLTLINIPDLTAGHVYELKHCFGKLRRRSFATNLHFYWENNETGAREAIPTWRCPTGTHHTVTSYPWKGGFYGIECTNEGRGWHLHLHALVDSQFIDGPELSRQWHAATNGFGKIVKVKDCRDHSYLQEITKYTVKGSDLAKWTPDQVVTFIEAFEGVRTFGVFGDLYGKRTEFAEWIKELREKKPLCTCGSCSIRYYTEAEFIMLDLKPNVQTKPRPPDVTPQTPDLFTMPADSRNAIGAMAR